MFRYLILNICVDEDCVEPRSSPYYSYGGAAYSEDAVISEAASYIYNKGPAVINEAFWPPLSLHVGTVPSKTSSVLPALLFPSFPFAMPPF